ncbi:MgtC/SapB family protein [Profundibacterium mesophilum]|uniref:Protein MgtC n=1 Tax=Profundibacterium mesophilum KAUST100406-0324 TaxID=1037889 RepID=A0A921TDA5_9RHOB|nr:MgtC/SapB family protein [Profundibacterium mesophilum]KAF0676126.1 Mg transport ATPase [Profundibacterium mesophilum KAUST100406-0324]
MLEILLDEMRGSFTNVPPAVAAARLTAALVLGGLIGIERERRGKPAGLRTHMLISVAAALFIIVSQQLGSLPFGSDGEIRIDPLRLIEAVTAGVAFLAAGIIFTSGGQVRNITTGASMWLSGAVGLACGSGQIPLAFMASVITVAIVGLVGAAERRMSKGDPEED